MQRDYNALTGEECLALLLDQIEAQLSTEGRLSLSQCYHNVTLRGNLELVSYPHEPEKEVFVVRASVGKKAPKQANARVEEVDFEQEFAVPDLARDDLAKAKGEKAVSKSAKDDATLLTNSESRMT